MKHSHKALQGLKRNGATYAGLTALVLAALFAVFTSDWKYIPPDDDYDNAQFVAH